MPIDPNQPDQALDQVLSALRNAAPPEDMDTRITQRLHLAASRSPAPSRLRSFLPTAAQPFEIWTQGALTGAAFATALTLCITLLIQHKSSVPSPTQTLAPIAMHSTTSQSTNVNLSPQRRPTSEPQTNPCAKPAITPQPRTASTPAFRELRAETHLKAIAPSHPAPALPLTPQERQLVRLVRTASPAQLAALNPEIEAKRDAEEAANFQRFFPPPPPRPAESNTTPEAPPTHPFLVNE